MVRALLLFVVALLLGACVQDVPAPTATPAALPVTEEAFAEEDRYAELREQMVSRQIEGRGVSDPSVLTVHVVKTFGTDKPLN